MSSGVVFLVIGLLLANAFFVGAEFAVISARRSSIEPLADAGSRKARIVLWAMENVSLMLATAQLGITVCSVSLGVVAEPAIAHALEPVMYDLGLPEAAAHTVAVIIALLIVVSLHVILGEMVPKNVAVSSPERAALLFGPPLVWVARVVKPLIGALNYVANRIVRLFGITPSDEITSAFTADEVHDIVEKSSEEGTIDDAHGLLVGAIEFSDKTAVDVMVAKEHVVDVEWGVTVEQLENVCAETRHSRIPVRSDGVWVGYLHLKDVLYARPGERENAVHHWRVRELLAVPADTEVETVLAQMQQSGTHIATVQQGGGAVGVIFLEDILEELVGEVTDGFE